MKQRIVMMSAAIVATALFLTAQPPAGAPGAGKGPGGGKGAPGVAKGKGKAPAYQAPTGPAPKLANGKPSLNGVWQRPFVQNMEQAYSQANAGATLPYTEWGKQQWDAYDAAKGDYTGSCLPFGHNRSINGPDPVQLLQTDDELAFLYEQNTWFKVLPTDGRAHNPRKVATWYGDSVGHWEGDTMVVVSKNFNGLTKLDTSGHPHSDQMVLTERFTRTDMGHIDYELTIDDPKTYSKPWGVKRQFTLRTDWQIQEYSCEENNKGIYEGRIKPPEYMKN
jgi:hypothetical protein